MPKQLLNHLHFLKVEQGPSLRDRITEFAEDGENVEQLIRRAVESGLGTPRRVRSAIYLGSKAKSAKFKLVEKKDLP